MPQKPEAASALYKAATPARRPGLRVAVFLSVSVVAAVGSALLLTRWMDRRTAEARVPTKRVVVAKADLPVGTELRAENLEALDWPVTSVPEGVYDDPKALEGKVIAARVFRREPILLAKLTDSPNAGLAALLSPGMRAAAVRVDDVVGVAGFVQPGDHVDVVVTLRTEGGHSITSSKIVLQNVKVLAVGKELDTKSRADKVVTATVATLMVDPEESERLALAAAQGKILLTLRSAADAEVVATRGATAALVLGPGGPVPQAPEPAKAAAAKRPARLARAPAEPAPAKAPGEVIEILRGDLFEKRTFDGGRR